MGKGENSKKESRVGVGCTKTAMKKRREGMEKKARELAILTQSQVALITYHADAGLHQYSSSSMQDIITRYTRNMRRATKVQDESQSDNALPREVYDVAAEPNAEEHLPENRRTAENQGSRYVLGMDFGRIELSDVDSLVAKLNKGLACIKDRKIQLLREELEQSKMNEEKQLDENDKLRKQVEELAGASPSPIFSTPSTINLTLELKLS